MAQSQIVDFLTVNGDGTGASTLAVDGSVTEVGKGYLVPEWADHIKIDQIRLYFEDDATVDADGSFMNLANGPAVLANGLEVGIYSPAVAQTIDAVNDTQVLNLMAVGLATGTKTGDFPACGWDYTQIDYTAGDSIVHVQRTFQTPLIIPRNHYIGVIVRDDLTAFTDAQASILGQVR